MSKRNFRSSSCIVECQISLTGPFQSDYSFCVEFLESSTHISHQHLIIGVILPVQSINIQYNTTTISRYCMQLSLYAIPFLKHSNLQLTWIGMVSIFSKEHQILVCLNVNVKCVCRHF